MCVKKEIQVMMNCSEVVNNTNTYTYMQSAVNKRYMHIHAKKGITLFFERVIPTMDKEFKTLYEVYMPVKPVVIILNHD